LSSINKPMDGVKALNVVKIHLDRKTQEGGDYTLSEGELSHLSACNQNKTLTRWGIAAATVAYAVFDGRKRGPFSGRVMAFTFLAHSFNTGAGVYIDAKCLQSFLLSKEHPLAFEGRSILRKVFPQHTYLNAFDKQYPGYDFNNAHKFDQLSEEEIEKLIEGYLAPGPKTTNHNDGKDPQRQDRKLSSPSDTTPVNPRHQLIEQYRSNATSTSTPPQNSVQSPLSSSSKPAAQNDHRDHDHFESDNHFDEDAGFDQEEEISKSERHMSAWEKRKMREESNRKKRGSRGTHSNSQSEESQQSPVGSFREETSDFGGNFGYDLKPKSYNKYGDPVY